MKQIVLWLILVMVGGCATKKTSPSAEVSARLRAEAVRGAMGTYNAPPRLSNRRVDIDRLMAELRDIHANTYNWLIAHGTNDWDDLKLFLPMARQNGLRVWVTLLPPSESPPHYPVYSEPFRLDYDRWVEELARLSLAEPSLVAWSIDDFMHNKSTFTPGRMGQLVSLSKAINPKLAFVPCVYFRQVTPDFAAEYGLLVDGILFPYRAESAKMNLTDAQFVESEVARLRELLGPEMPIILDVYASSHSRLGSSTAGYVDEAMQRGFRSCDGVLIYCHQNPVNFPDKYGVLKKNFGANKQAGRSR